MHSLRRKRNTARSHRRAMGILALAIGIAILALAGWLALEVALVTSD